MVYAPMMWGTDHWVGLCINFLTANVTILDSYISHNRTIEQLDAHMAPLLSSLPYILKQYVGHTVHHAKEGQLYYSWSRVDGIYNNGRTGDCGTCAAKFIEMHANCDGKEEMSMITDKIVDMFREKYAMDCYEEFVGDFRVANKG